MNCKKLFDQLGAHFSAEKFEQNTRRIYELEKRICHDDFIASTDYVMQALAEAGFSDIERISHVADGEYCVNDSVMPEAWNLDGRATLKVISPWPEDERIIADTDEVPFAAATWSGATPAGGAVGELVMYDPENIESARGKWVFYDGMPRGTVNQPLAKAGALGMVVTDTEQGWHDPDSTHWMNGQGTWGWYYVKGEPRLPIFVITLKRAMKLLNELRSGRPVMLEGILNSRYGAGEVYTVTARIPGESDEEYGLLAHMYEPFLSDDNSGVAAGIEIGRMIKNSNLKLKKSLRVVYSFEHYGFVDFFVNYPHKLRAAMNLDMISTTMYERLGFPMHWRTSSVSLPFFGDLLMLEILRQCAPDLRIDVGPGTLSDDTMAAEPSYGIPTNWLYVENEPSPLHHSSAGIFNDVDWALAERASKLVAVMAAFLMSADRAEYMAVLPALQHFAVEQASAHRFETPFCRKVRCDFAVGQLLSVNEWMNDLITPAEVEALLAPSRLPLEDMPPVTENEKIAAELFVKRLHAGTPWSLAAIPYEERDYCNGRINKVYYTLLDGSRSLLDAIRITDAALSCKTTDEQLGCVIKFMQYLSRYGYVEIKNSVF